MGLLWQKNQNKQFWYQGSNPKLKYLYNLRAKRIYSIKSSQCSARLIPDLVQSSVPPIIKDVASEFLFFRFFLEKLLRDVMRLLWCHCCHALHTSEEPVVPVGKLLSFSVCNNTTFMMTHVNFKRRQLLFWRFIGHETWKKFVVARHKLSGNGQKC